MRKGLANLPASQGKHVAASAARISTSIVGVTWLNLTLTCYFTNILTYCQLFPLLPLPLSHVRCLLSVCSHLIYYFILLHNFVEISDLQIAFYVQLSRKYIQCLLFSFDTNAYPLLVNRHSSHRCQPSNHAMHLLKHCRTPDYVPNI